MIMGPIKNCTEEIGMENKELICRVLKETGRPGMDRLLNYMDQAGFYEAPCNTQYHLAREREGWLSTA